MPARPRTPPGMYCKTCLYDLRGSVGSDDRSGHACPECGRAFDPRRPRTTLRHPTSRSLRFWLRPPWVLAGGFFFAGVVFLWAASQPEGGPALSPFFPFDICLVFIGMITWLMRVLVLAGLLTLSRRRRVYHIGVTGVIAWASPVLVWLGCEAVIASGTPQRLTWSWSRPSMETHARQLLIAHGPAHQPMAPNTRRWFGTVHAGVELFGDGVFFHTAGFVDSQGVVFFPNGLPSPLPPLYANHQFWIDPQPLPDPGWYRFMAD
ncbi:MAG: hypothetical protein AAGI68_12795 [Planctomycetota bacterium]